MAEIDPPNLAFLGPPQSPDEIGRLGDYRILGVLGQGGMGIVLHGEDSTLHRAVAIKVMLPELARQSSYRERFLREARCVAAVENENIIRIHHLGEDRGLPFLVMPLLRGHTLDQEIVTGEPMRLRRVIHIALQITAGLEAAHQRELVHRDLKPANIWLNEEDRVILLDFGLARSVRKDAGLTESGAVIGTPAYMSPEQALGELVDTRSDLFSLGSVLYEMATGRRPFQGGNTLSIMNAIIERTPTPCRDINPRIPISLRDLINELHAKEPERRPAAAAEVRQRLRSIQDELASGWDETTLNVPNLTRPQPRTRRSFLLCLATVLLAALLLYLTWPKKEHAAQLPSLPSEKSEPEPPKQADHTPVGKSGIDGASALDHLDSAEVPEEGKVNGVPEIVAWVPAHKRKDLAAGKVHGFVPPKGSIRWKKPQASADGRWLLTNSGVFQLWDMGGKAPRERELPPEIRGAIWQGGLSGNGRRTAVVKDQRLLIIEWDDKDIRIVRAFKNWDPKQYIEAMSPDGTRILTQPGGRPGGGVIQIWDVSGEEATVITKISQGAKGQTLLGYLENGRQVVTASPDGKIRFWEESSGWKPQILPEPDASINGIYMTPDGRSILLATGRSKEREFQIWKKQAGLWKCSKSVRSDYGEVDFLSSTLLLTKRADSSFSVHDLETGKLIWSKRVPVNVYASFAGAPDGRHFFIETGEGGIYVLRLPRE